MPCHCALMANLICQNGGTYHKPWYLWYTWWRHQMETFSALLAICAGNSPVPVKSPHKGQWRVALMFTLICARINGWVNNHEAGDLRRHRAHYDVIVMQIPSLHECQPLIDNAIRYDWIGVQYFSQHALTMCFVELSHGICFSLLGSNTVILNHPYLISKTIN